MHCSFNYDDHGAATRTANKFGDGDADHVERYHAENESGGAETGSRPKVERAQKFLR